MITVTSCEHAESEEVPNRIQAVVFDFTLTGNSKGLINFVLLKHLFLKCWKMYYFLFELCIFQTISLSSLSGIACFLVSF